MRCGGWNLRLKSGSVRSIVHIANWFYSSYYKLTCGCRKGVELCRFPIVHAHSRKRSTEALNYLGWAATAKVLPCDNDPPVRRPFRARARLFQRAHRFFLFLEVENYEVRILTRRSGSTRDTELTVLYQADRDYGLTRLRLCLLG